MPAKSEPTTTIHVRIEDSCLECVRGKLRSPYTLKVPRGALSRLVQELLWEWIVKQNKDSQEQPCQTN